MKVISKKHYDEKSIAKIIEKYYTTIGYHYLKCILDLREIDPNIISFNKFHEGYFIYYKNKNKKIISRNI